MYNYTHSPKEALAVDFIGGKGYNLTICTKAFYDEILTFKDDVKTGNLTYFSDKLTDIVAKIMCFNTENKHFTPCKVKKMFVFDGKKIDYEAMSKLFCAYYDFIAEIESSQKYQLPYYPYGVSEKIYFVTYTQSEKYVSDYSGLNFKEIEELPLDAYLMLLHDAYIYYLSKSKEGREYLENAYILMQTKPDRKALRAKYGRKE